VPPALGQNIILGVLEDVPGSYAGEKHWSGVRTVFHKDGAGWKAYATDCTEPTECQETAAQFPSAQKWTIGFEGKRVGEVSTRRPDEADLGSHIGLQKLNDAAAPRFGKPSADFGGFLGEPVYRPLIANTQPYVSDPDLWKPTQPAPDVLANLRKAFRQKYPRLCPSAEGKKSTPFSYKDEAVLLKKAYASKAGLVIARLHVAKATACDDEEAGFEMDDPWFVITPKGGATFLGAGICLVDAGDYDNDGHSELIFAIDRYNRGGYILYRADFSKSATFEFSYH
jgi:hypothetical protein